jgi:hypothetical protein
LALNTALVSRQTWTSPLPTSISDAAGRVLPTKWLCLDRPCVAQHLHHLVALGRAHLQQHAQFLVEQRLERQFLAPRADLRRPSSWRRHSRRGCR